MSDITTLMMAAAGAGGEEADYQISRSLRFNSADSAYLNRTPASTTDRTKWSLSLWVKRSALGSVQTLLGARINGDNYFRFGFNASDQLNVDGYYASTQRVLLTTTPVYRDVSAFYHIVIVGNTPDATSSNRFKVYVNGVQVTAFGTATYPSQNAIISPVNETSVVHEIGRYPLAVEYFNGYLAEIHFVDNQALTPSDFGETDATTGVWKPKAYTGTYGTNGFYLDFSDNSSTTALGTDSSGNGNNWTPNNFSVTAGAGNDSLVDTPTNYGVDTGAGGEVRGSYCTLNALKNQGNTLGNGNLNITATTTSGTTIVFGTIGMSSGKWYWEYTQLSMTVLTNVSMIGIAKDNASLAAYVGYDANGWGYYGTGNKYTNNSASAYGAGYTNNDVMGVAFDADAGTLVFYKNGVSQGTAFSGLTSGPYFPAFSDGGSTTVMTAVVNFGQRPFAYPVSGFKALCTQNIAEGTITTSGTFTGNGSTNGPFVYLNGVPTAMTIDGNAVTFGTHADKLANGFKVRSSSASYNANATSMSYTISTTGAKFKYANAQPNP